MYIERCIWDYLHGVGILISLSFYAHYSASIHFLPKLFGNFVCNLEHSVFKVLFDSVRIFFYLFCLNQNSSLSLMLCWSMYVGILYNLWYYKTWGSRLIFGALQCVIHWLKFNKKRINKYHARNNDSKQFSMDFCLNHHFIMVIQSQSHCDYLFYFVNIKIEVTIIV